MENITQKFIEAKIDFQNSNASEISIERLYDLIYFLKVIPNKTFAENYTLAQIYNLVGQYILALNIIEKAILNANQTESEQWEKLQIEIKQQDKWNVKYYRDLRDSKILKKPTILGIEDLIVTKSKYNSQYCIKISDNVKNIVLLNKNLPNDTTWTFEEFFLFADYEPDNFLLKCFIEHIEWLGQIKKELLIFYNNKYFNHKLNYVDENWFDGLYVFDFYISVDNNSDFHTCIYLKDYLQNDFGFTIKIENKTFKSIEYNPEL